MDKEKLDLDALRKSTLVANAKAFLVLVLLIHVPAFTFGFWQGWLYVVVFSACALWAALYFLKHDPALVASRQKAGAGAEREKSQKWIQGIASVVGCAMFVVPGIERHFTGLPLPVPLVILADMLVAGGFWIVYLSLRENSHASSIIEVKSGQPVVSTGPYALVRHPMYSGCVLLFLATPLALGSLWALPFAIVLVLVLAIRLLDEERYLKANLQGYDAYCRKVKVHLVPYVW
ncbi:MAG: methyltransferase family protein [Phyllobacterium sp.]